jgi:murein DD-endopeptidase MepM/ murein hydrolase activator NlpD
LLALASSIALTEYISYSPVVSDPDATEDEVNQLSNDITPATKDNIEDRAEKVSENAQKPLTMTSELPVVREDPSLQSDISKIVINSGDTITSVLTKLNFDRIDVYLASQELSKAFNLRNLKIGQEISVRHHKDGDKLVLDVLELQPDVTCSIVVSRNASGKFQAKKIEKPLKKVLKTASGTMLPGNLVATAIKCGVKRNIAMEAVRVIGQVANMNSSKEPINFEFLYRDFYGEDGRLVAQPELVYASALVSGSILRIYKFRFRGVTEYVDSNCVSLKSILKSRSALAKPLSFMKITSKYGDRMHPVYGSRKRHTGIDLKAGIGVPVYAAANGKVEKACYYSGYGLYIKIRHTDGIETAYGHLSRISIRPGQYVVQGQIIGTVGVTGITTGAHLHYEVIKNGQFINPMSIIKQEPQKLTGEKLEKFNQFRRQVNLQIVGLIPWTKKKTTKVKKFS